LNPWHEGLDASARLNALARALMLLTLLLLLVAVPAGWLSVPQLAGSALVAAMVLVGAGALQLTAQADRAEAEQQIQEGMTSMMFAQKDPPALATTLYRIPTADNPYGNLTPGLVRDSPEAPAAPPANNAEADAERAKLMFGDTLLLANPRNTELVKALKEDTAETYEYRQLSERTFFTNPVTTAAPDFNAYADFMFGKDYRTRVLPQDAWLVQGQAGKVGIDPTMHL